jgi:hypothetical protein
MMKQLRLTRILLSLAPGLLMFSMSSTSIGGARSEPTRVMIVATLHGRHKSSHGYSYEDLYALVKKFDPDFVGVEIRAEDIHRDPDYLTANYPTEMIALAQTWGSRAFGFDWLGDDVAGAAIPGDWWAARSPLKRLERELDQDLQFKSEKLESIRARQQTIIDTATPATFNDGRYDQLNDEYYEVFNKSVAGSRYQPIANFYMERDTRIGRNLAAAIRARHAKRVLIALGADHRSFAIRSLRRSMGASIQLVPVAAIAPR